METLEASLSRYYTKLWPSMHISGWFILNWHKFMPVRFIPFTWACFCSHLSHTLLLSLLNLYQLYHIVSLVSLCSHLFHIYHLSHLYLVAACLSCSHLSCSHLFHLYLLTACVNWAFKLEHADTWACWLLLLVHSNYEFFWYILILLEESIFLIHVCSSDTCWSHCPILLCPCLYG